jgi:hypothetical protein
MHRVSLDGRASPSGLRGAMTETNTASSKSDHERSSLHSLCNPAMAMMALSRESTSDVLKGKQGLATCLKDTLPSESSNFLGFAIFHDTIHAPKIPRNSK